MPQPWRPRLMLSLLETSKRMSSCSCQLWLEDWDLRANLLLPACLPTKIAAVKTKTSPVGAASPLTRGNRCKYTNNSENHRRSGPGNAGISMLRQAHRAGRETACGIPGTFFPILIYGVLPYPTVQMGLKPARISLLNFKYQTNLCVS